MSLYYVKLTHSFNKRKTLFSFLISHGIIRAMVGSGVSPLLRRIFSIGSLSTDLLSRISFDGSSQSDLPRRIFSVRSPPADLLRRISSNGSSQSDLLRRIFSGGSSHADLRLIFSVGSPLADLLSRISFDRSSQLDLLRRIFLDRSPPTDLLLRIFSYGSSPTVLNSITSTPSWNTLGVALPSTSDRIKYTFITSLVHITYMLQFEGEC